MEETKDQSSPLATDNISIGQSEPWESWETKLVFFSLVIGIGILVIGGVLVNMFVI